LKSTHKTLHDELRRQEQQKLATVGKNKQAKLDGMFKASETEKAQSWTQDRMLLVNRAISSWLAGEGLKASMAESDGFKRMFHLATRGAHQGIVHSTVTNHASETVATELIPAVSLPNSAIVELCR